MSDEFVPPPDPIFAEALKVKDEKSFVHFLKVLRDDYGDHWESRTPREFLGTMAWWGSGDFADGEHGGDPLLQRVAVMLAVGRTRQHENDD
ncbi:MAG: hypothetical protein JOZ54_00810 [Acidobacteria bacterium]|nr:hypothetical protein [Acidobacteriota bacterium]